MSRDQFNQIDLTEDQYFRIIEVLKDYGNDIPKNEFPEYVLRSLRNPGP